MTKAAKDSSSRLVAGFHRNFSQDSGPKIRIRRGKATNGVRGGNFLSHSYRTLNVAETNGYLIEPIVLYRFGLVGQQLVSSCGNVG